MPSLPVPAEVDWMLTPGALMSGFSPLSPVRGPAELKLAKPAGEPGLVMAAFRRGAGRRCRRGQCRAALHAEERDRHGVRSAVVGIRRSALRTADSQRVVDHRDRRCARLLSEDRLGDTRAITAVHDDERARRDRAVGGDAAAE